VVWYIIQIYFKAKITQLYYLTIYYAKP
jgi:hypothetical protein